MGEQVYIISEVSSNHSRDIQRAKKFIDTSKEIGCLPELSDYTHSLGMKFSCTPFYLEAVAELEPFVDFYKIASYELLTRSKYF